MAPADNSGDNNQEKKKRNPWGPVEPPRGPWGNLGGNSGGSQNNGNGQRPNSNKSDIDDMLKGFQDKFRNAFPGDGNSNRLIVFGIIALLALWLASGFILSSLTRTQLF